MLVVWTLLAAAVTDLPLARAQTPTGGERTVSRVSIKPQPSQPVAPPFDGGLLPPLPQPAAPAPTPAAAALLPPDIPPLGLPSDGEEAPSFPDLPDLPTSSLPPELLPPAGENGAGVELPPLPEEGGAPEDALLPPPATGTPPASRAAPMAFPDWHQNPAKAYEIAASQQRCLLLAFSSKAGLVGETCRLLNIEVLASPAFNELALGHLVLCNLFYERGSGLNQEATQLRHEDALAEVKKKFKVRGFPTVILFGPDGKEIRRWTGYAQGRGLAVYQQIKQAVDGHEAVLFETERRREKMAAKGYRTWTSRQGHALFAKLVEFDAHMVLLRDESGSERRVQLDQLALPDRERVTRQRLGKPMPRVEKPADTSQELR